MSKKTFCIGCGKEIWRYSKRCRKCHSINFSKNQLGIKNPNYKNGLSKGGHCKECKKKIGYGAIKYGSGLCKSCSHKGNRMYNYIDNRSKTKYKCRICDSIIGYASYCYGDKTCRCCASKLKARKGKDNTFYGRVFHGKWGKYKGSYMRSSWEVAYARYCIKNHIKYRYEPKVFEIIYKYKGIKKEGTYRPDFYLPETKTYIEIKGYWRDDAKVKFNAFKKRYKNIKVLMKSELIYLGVL